MFETADELAELDDLLGASLARSNDHLRSIITPGERTLNAVQLAAVLIGISHLTVATVTATGEPRVSAVDGHFLHGRFVFSTTSQAAKIRHLRARPAVSASHLRGDALGVFVHGTADIIGKGDTDGTRLDGYLTSIYGVSPYTFGDEIVFVRIQPVWMVAYAFRPDDLLRSLDR